MVRFIVRLTAVLIVASLPVPLSAQEPESPRHPRWSGMTWLASYEARQGPETTEKITRSFKVGPSGTLDIGNVAGRIVVTAGGGDTIEVLAVKRIRSHEGNVKAQLEHTIVTMTERAGRVEVKTTYGERNVRVAVDYMVTAPAGTSVYARSISGDIRVEGIKGEVRAEAVSGDIMAIRTPGVTLARSVSGEVTVSGVASPAELRASSVSGTVTVRDAKVRNLDADSISGDINLAGTECERVTARTISGSIAFAGPLARNGRYDFKSQSGDIRLALAGETGFDVDASSFSGNIRSDLPVTTRGGREEPDRHARHGLHGVHGDGSAQLLLSSFSGDITIARK